MKARTPVALVILDGFGSDEPGKSNAISQASTPALDHLIKHYPHTLLRASGPAVGLPEGFVGNSKVGHMTIGAGQIIPQALTVINNAIEDKSFFTNRKLTQALKELADKKKAVHIIGLLSDAGVHGMLEHIIAYARAARDAGVADIIIHPILDGRDVAPYSAAQYLAQLEKQIQHISGACIGIVIGRFYAMDRDNNWDRTCVAYDALMQPHSISTSWKKQLEASYATGQSEEFIPPFAVSNEIIRSGDGVILTNIRSERMKQIYTMLIGSAPVHCAQPTVDISFCLTAVQYLKAQYEGFLFEIEKPHTTLKETLSKAGYSMFSIAETEKYAHVTSFFEGRNAEPYQNEERVLVPSIKVKTYVDYPCMSAPEITNRVIHSLEKNPADFYLINYANADMVGHSGSLKATIAAIECLDKQIGKLYREFVEKRNGILIIAADHGNAEKMVDDRGNPDTAHTENKVPFIVASKDAQKISLAELHGLSDIAPFILQMFEIAIPPAMKKAR